MKNIGDDYLSTSDIEEMIDDLELSKYELEREELYLEMLEVDRHSTKEMIETARERVSKAFDDFDEDLYDELIAFRDELEGYCDWRHGETLIHVRSRRDYAEQLAEDIGELKQTNWPHNYIDWEAATEELFRHDYTYSEVEGHRYYVRTC